MRAATVLPLEQTPVLRVPTIGCNVELRRSSRAKRFSLKVSHTERAAILTLPNRGRVEDASAFLSRHADWLRRQLERLPAPVPFNDGAVIPLRGELHCLKFAGMQRHAGVVTVLRNGADAPRSADAPVTLNWRSQCCSASAFSLPQICIS